MVNVIPGRNLPVLNFCLPFAQWDQALQSGTEKGENKSRREPKIGSLLARRFFCSVTSFFAFFSHYGVWCQAIFSPSDAKWTESTLQRAVRISTVTLFEQMQKVKVFSIRPNETIWWHEYNFLYFLNMRWIECIILKSSFWFSPRRSYVL